MRTDQVLSPRLLRGDRRVRIRRGLGRLRLPQGPLAGLAGAELERARDPLRAPAPHGVEPEERLRGADPPRPGDLAHRHPSALLLRQRADALGPAAALRDRGALRQLRLPAGGGLGDDALRRPGDDPLHPALPAARARQGQARLGRAGLPGAPSAGGACAARVGAPPADRGRARSASAYRKTGRQHRAWENSRKSPRSWPT